MYGQPRFIDSTLYAIKGKFLRYYIFIEPAIRHKIKQVYIKTDVLMKKLELKCNRYMLSINPVELSNINVSCPYKIIVRYKDNSEEQILEGQIVIVR